MVKNKIVLTLDLDNHIKREALKVAQNIKKELKCNVWIRKSAGDGFHIKTDFENTPKKIFKLRLHYDDDTSRVFADMIRHFNKVPLSELFDYKNGKGAKEWKEI